MKSKTASINDTQLRIVTLLQKNNEMTYSQIKKEIGITDAAISRNLTKLLKRKIIEFTKQGREKYYKIGKNAKEIFEIEIEMMFNLYMGIFTTRYSVIPFPETLEDVLEDIQKTMSTYYLYCLFKSIETGKNWIKSFHAESFSLVLLDVFYNQIFETKKLPEELEKNLREGNFEKIFQKTHKSLESRHIERLEALYDFLRKKCPEQMLSIEDPTKTKTMNKLADVMEEQD